ncbi:MAG: twitching motility protein PilT [Lachnospiraceae bacterium]|nr:twitching motility protein PilT [Lachnospiraceae bacterium]
MIQLILGNKGKGKTKILLDKANTEIKTAHGSIVYLDKSAKHMYELNNKVRLIDISSFDLNSSEEFIGFIYGILSQDHDLEQMYLDSFLTIAKAEDAATTNAVLETLCKIGEKFDVSFIISISMQSGDIDPKFKENIIAEL